MEFFFFFPFLNGTLTAAFCHLNIHNIKQDILFFCLFFFYLRSKVFFGVGVDWGVRWGKDKVGKLGRDTEQEGRGEGGEDKELSAALIKTDSSFFTIC